MSQYSHTEVSITKHKENWLDACENRWLRRIMWISLRIKTGSQRKRSDRGLNTGTNVQWDQTDVIKMA